MLKWLMWILVGVHFVSCRPSAQMSAHCSPDDSATYSIRIQFENQNTGHGTTKESTRFLDMEWHVRGDRVSSDGIYSWNIRTHQARWIHILSDTGKNDTTILSLPSDHYVMRLDKKGKLIQHDLSMAFVEIGYPEIAEILNYCLLFHPIGSSHKKWQTDERLFTISGMKARGYDIYMPKSKDKDRIIIQHNRLIKEIIGEGDWKVNFDIKGGGYHSLDPVTGWPNLVNWEEKGIINVALQPEPVKLTRNIRCSYVRK